MRNLEDVRRLVGLEQHIKYNFYPRHPLYVEESMIDGFKKYWAGEIDEMELAEYCYIRDVDALFHYFSPWLEEAEGE